MTALAFDRTELASKTRAGTVNPERVSHIHFGNSGLDSEVSRKTNSPKPLHTTPVSIGSDSVSKHPNDLLRRSTDPLEALLDHRGVIGVPRRQIERRPARVEPAVSPYDVRDRFGLDLPLRTLGPVVDVEVQQGMCVLVNERHREIGLILSVLHFDERLERMRTPLGTDTFRSPMLPLVGRNDPDVDAQVPTSIERKTNTEIVEDLPVVEQFEGPRDGFGRYLYCLLISPNSIPLKQ